MTYDDTESIGWKPWMQEYGIIESDSDDDECLALIDKNSGLIHSASRYSSPSAVFSMFLDLQKIDSTIRLEDFRLIRIMRAKLES